VLNLLALAFFVRFDLTDSKLYSLSDASKRIAQSLDDPIVVKLYFSEDLPAPYNQNARYLKDQLYEYRAFSGGKLRFEFIDRSSKRGKRRPRRSAFRRSRSTRTRRTRSN